MDNDTNKVQNDTNKIENDTMISVRGIHKSFGNNKVLKGIDLDVKPGEVISLIGGNGAGKSTLVKIIMGIYQQDSGDVYIKGEKVNLNKPSVALSHGIYLVPQEPMLFPNMSVEENIIMGFKEKNSILHKKLLELIKTLGWGLDLNRKADSLSIAEQQLVEILRGLLRDARILILDEPTSSLTFNEVESLFKIIEDLKKKKISIIYITHRLNEVFDISTNVAIMRDGMISMQGKTEEFTREILVKGLLPQNVCEKQEKVINTEIDYENLKPVLKVENLSGYGFKNITFDIYPGEILGLAGVVGAGRTELATTIFGRDTVKNGRVFLDGDDITGLSTSEILRKGLNYVTEDRFLKGIFKISDVSVNTTAACLDSLGKVFLNKKAENQLADKYIEDFRTKVTGNDQIIGSLSGGNQQKVVIAKALSTNPKVVILDEPTRGIDACARGDVYRIIHQLREQGLAILLISSDIEEIIELSDRALTMYCGKINCTFKKSEINQDNLMAAAFGVYKGGMSNE